MLAEDYLKKNRLEYKENSHAKAFLSVIRSTGFKPNIFKLEHKYGGRLFWDREGSSAWGEGEGKSFAFLRSDCRSYFHVPDVEKKP